MNNNIRRAIIEADLVDCMVALPGQLFYTTQIPACLWFLTKSKTAKPMRHRKGETLFIDSRKLGVLVDPTVLEATGHKRQSARDSLEGGRRRSSSPAPRANRLDPAGKHNSEQMSGFLLPRGWG